MRCRAQRRSSAGAARSIVRSIAPGVVRVDRAELDELDETLGLIVAGAESAGTVANVVRQVICQLGP